MTTLVNVTVGDKVTIEFEVSHIAGSYVYLKNAAVGATLAFDKDTVVKEIQKAPKFKVGDKVKAWVYANGTSYICKTGVIKFMDGRRAWVTWEANRHQASHESLFKLDKLSKA